MGRIIKSGTWKSVDFKGAVFDQLDGVVGIEELSDYSFGDEDKSLKTTKPNTKKRKKNAVETCNKNKPLKTIKIKKFAVEASKEELSLDATKTNIKNKKDVIETTRNEDKSLNTTKTNIKKRKKNVVGTCNENEFVKPNNANIKKKKKNAEETCCKSKMSIGKKPLNKFIVEPTASIQKVDKTVHSDFFTDNLSLETDSFSSESEAPWNNVFVPPEIIRALLENGYKEPTPIQAACIPPAIRGRRDILGAAETGSGKTLAFGIPMLYGIMKNVAKLKDQVSDDNEEEQNEIENQSFTEPVIENSDSTEMGCVRAIDFGPIRSSSSTHVKHNPCINNKLWGLVLAPTRELALQVEKHLISAAKYTGIQIAVVVGGMSSEKQERLLKRRPHIVVATPGRLWELISKGEEHFSEVSSIRFLVVDEADRMTEVNHFPELRALLEHINGNPEHKKQRQNFLFSATLSLVRTPRELPARFKKGSKKRKKLLTPAQKLQNFIDVIGITNPKIVDITKKNVLTDNLTEACIRCSFENKDLYLYYFLKRHPGRTLIFCNSISCVRRLASLLNILECHPLPLHANMMQRQRLKNLDKFRDNPFGVLLATDVAARGLDIPNVQYVIHYQVPRTSESYVHRSGRTARANEEGLTLTLIEPNEMAAYAKLCRNLKREDELPDFPVDQSLMQAVKERVHLARDIDQIELTTKKKNSHIGWMEKAADEMDILLDDDLLYEKMDPEKAAQIKRATHLQRKKLSKLLSKTLMPLKITSDMRYPSIASFNEMLSNTENSAIDIVKSSVTQVSKKKKKT